MFSFVKIWGFYKKILEVTCLENKSIQYSYRALDEFLDDRHLLLQWSPTCGFPAIAKLHFLTVRAIWEFPSGCRSTGGRSQFYDVEERQQCPVVVQKL